MTRKNVLSADNQQGRVQQHLQPWYVCGLVDGEGSFHVALYKDAQMKVGTKAIPEFHVSQRVSSRRVLDELVRFFQCGYVKENHRTNPNDVTYVYVVRDRMDLLTKIIPFFEKYQLQTEKRNDAKIFAKIVRSMAQRHHRDRRGMQTIIELAYTMNGAGRYRKRPKEMLM